ncbi:DedA family protein [Lysobacter sp. KIS68-7]|uniref:YqaA family protein n=1 Tax=Lysobacter sp. KIS68-7 TaxID=2904252 RepID=UPI001E493CA3|nr:YqaA family protein [Lysobacter sp. KIS68-7]UHQ18246.1 DedA family protein [Lysobacter sp. KIS68-7]
MKLFGPLYERTIALARHPRASLWLVLLSFFEAIIFPIMPEVMLVPMCVAKPKRGFWFATISLAGSMVGALVGYFLGHYAFEALKPVFAAVGLLHGIEAGITIVQAKMAQSPWAVFTFLVLGGFMPIPMKVFTWASGIVGVPLLPYIASMAVGRGKRVYLLALVVRLGGERAEETLRKYIEPVGWAATVLVVGLVGWLIVRAHGA